MPSESVRKQKEQMVAGLADQMKSSCAGVLAEYKGVSVEDDTRLRRQLREAGVRYLVAKNTLLSRASEAANLDDLKPHLKGTTAIAFSASDYTAAARILSEFAEKHPDFRLKAGFIDGAVIDAAEVNTLAKLPSKEELIAKALGGLNAPITGLVYVLNANISGLARVLGAIAAKQGA